MCSKRGKTERITDQSHTFLLTYPLAGCFSLFHLTVCTCLCICVRICLSLWPCLLACVSLPVYLYVVYLSVSLSSINAMCLCRSLCVSVCAFSVHIRLSFSLSPFACVLCFCLHVFVTVSVFLCVSVHPWLFVSVLSLWSSISVCLSLFICLPVNQCPSLYCGSIDTTTTPGWLPPPPYLYPLSNTLAMGRAEWRWSDWSWDGRVLVVSEAEWKEGNSYRGNWDERTMLKPEVVWTLSTHTRARAHLFTYLLTESWRTNLIFWQICAFIFFLWVKTATSDETKM